MRMPVLAVIATVVLTVSMGGCAQAPAAPGLPGSVGGVSPSVPAPSPSSIACPQIDETPLPPECIPYDPQALMDANERYRQRMPVHPESFAAFEAERAGITAAIEELQLEDGLTPEAVKQVLIDAGFLHEDRDGVNAWEKDGEIVFNGVGPVGGCVFGTATPSSFEMDIQGVIMDGGCHEAFAH